MIKYFFLKKVIFKKSLRDLLLKVVMTTNERKE